MEQNGQEKGRYTAAHGGAGGATPVKMPLWRQLVNSFCGPRKYPPFLQLSSGSVVLYFFFVTAIVTVFSTIVPNVGYVVGVGGIRNFITQRIPDFTLADGKLTMDGTLEYETSQMKLYIDTSVSQYTKKDVDESAYLQILVSSSNILVYTNGMLTEYSLSDFASIQYDQDQLLRMVPVLYIGMGAYWLMAFIGKALYALSTMLLLAVVGLFSNSLYRFRVSFGQLFTLALYATTIVSILESINTALSLISAAVVSMIGMLWTAFVFFGALAVCGGAQRMGRR